MRMGGRKRRDVTALVGRWAEITPVLQSVVLRVDCSVGTLVGERVQYKRDHQRV